MGQEEVESLSLEKELIKISALIPKTKDLPKYVFHVKAEISRSV